jgi:hypothetical protein
VALTCSSTTNAAITTNVGGSTARQVSSSGSVTLTGSTLTGYYYAPQELYT